MDTTDGGIKLITGKTSISGTYALSALAGTGEVEIDMATRIRVMGLYERETYDATAMRLYGNVYVEASNEDVETSIEADYDAHSTLDEILQRRGIHTLVGAGDPRVEPRDLISYTLESGSPVVQAMVDSVSFTISLAGDSPTFDMKVEAIDA